MVNRQLSDVIEGTDITWEHLGTDGVADRDGITLERVGRKGRPVAGRPFGFIRR